MKIFIENLIANIVYYVATAVIYGGVCAVCAFGFIGLLALANNFLM